MSENNRSDYEKEKEARERRLRAYDYFLLGTL